MEVTFYFLRVRLIVEAPLLVIAGCYLNKEIRNDVTNIGNTSNSYKPKRTILTNLFILYQVLLKENKIYENYEIKDI